MLHHMHEHRDRVAGAETRGITIRWARFYDLATSVMLLGQEPRMRTMTIDLAMVQPGERVLEVGCGTGSLALAAARRVGMLGKVFGIDPDPVMIDLARRKAAKLHRDVEFEVAAIEALPFQPGECDVVLSSLMLHHLPDDLKALGLAEVRRVLRARRPLLGRRYAASHRPDFTKDPGSPARREDDAGRANRSRAGADPGRVCQG